MIKNVNIYKGPIYRIYADNVVFANKGTSINYVSEKITEDSLFYLFRGLLINLKYNCVLSEEYQAEDYIKSIINTNYNKINIASISEEEKKSLLRKVSSCVYYKPDEVSFSHKIPKRIFKELKKEYKKNRK